MTISTVLVVIPFSEGISRSRSCSTLGRYPQLLLLVVAGCLIRLIVTPGGIAASSCYSIEVLRDVTSMVPLLCVGCLVGADNCPLSF